MPKSKIAKPKMKRVKPKQKRAMPHFGKAPEELVRVFEAALKDFPMAQQKLTFGSPAAYVNGKMFCGLHNDKFILRLSPDDCEKLFAQGATPFMPMPGRAMKGWVTVSRAMLDDARELNAWMEKAMEWTRGMAKKRK
ncbi:MAG: TfoX/Sxy family protein [Chloroflexi bacterium]|nr:TfoX/Sxy family protein [Chloroflexota bacterium]